MSDERAHDPYCDLSRGLGGCNCLPDFGAPARIWIRHGTDVFHVSVPDADEYVHASLAVPRGAAEQEGERRIAELEAALRPFAAYIRSAVERLEREETSPELITVTLVTERYREGSAHEKLEYATVLGHVTLGDLRRATLILRSTTEQRSEPT